jgi:hypothetical protein
MDIVQGIVIIALDHTRDFFHVDALTIGPIAIVDKLNNNKPSINLAVNGNFVNGWLKLINVQVQ